MNGLFLLVSISLLPVDTGKYTQSTIVGRDAFFLQTGLKQEWDNTRQAVERKIPPTLRHTASVTAAAYKRKLELRTDTWGMYYADKNNIRATYSFSF